MGTYLSNPDARRILAAAAIAGCLFAAGCGQQKADGPSAVEVAGLVQQHLGDTSYASITFGGAANDASSNDAGIVKALVAAHLVTPYTDGTIQLTPVGQALAKNGWEPDASRAPNDNAVVYLIPTAQRELVKVDDQRASAPVAGAPIVVAYTWHYVPVGAVATYAAQHGFAVSMYEPGGGSESLDRDAYGAQYRGSLTLEKNTTTDKWSVLEQAKPACTPSPGPSAQPTS